MLSSEVWSVAALTEECDVSDNTVGSALLGVDSLCFSTLDDAIPIRSGQHSGPFSSSQQSRKRPAHVEAVSQVLELRLQTGSDSCIKQKTPFIVYLCCMLLIKDHKPHYTALIAHRTAQPSSSNEISLV